MASFNEQLQAIQGAEEAARQSIWAGEAHELKWGGSSGGPALLDMAARGQMLVEQQGAACASQESVALSQGAAERPFLHEVLGLPLATLQGNPGVDHVEAMVKRYRQLVHQVKELGNDHLVRLNKAKEVGESWRKRDAYLQQLRQTPNVPRGEDLGIDLKRWPDHARWWDIAYDPVPQSQESFGESQVCQ